MHFHRPQWRKKTLVKIILWSSVAIGLWCVMYYAFFAPVRIEENSVYRIKMEGVLVEQSHDEDLADVLRGLLPWGNRQQEVGLNQILSNIRLSKTHPNIKGIYLEGGDLEMGPAQAEELRRALLDFKQSGKWVIAYAHSYGTANYYVASVADRLYLNPTGMVRWHGMAGRKMYYTRLMEKLGVEMQILKVGTFKSAVEPFFRTSMSDADREQTNRFIRGIWDEMVDGVAQSRGLSADSLNAWADRVLELEDPLRYPEWGLVDSLVYDQSMDDILKTLCGGEKPHLVSTDKMAKVERDEPDTDNIIAVIYAEGDISDDSEEGIGGKQMVALMDKVRKTEGVKAVVLRINSPGGSADASEQLWHAEQLIRQAGIPLVVSQSTYAASGGYYMSCAADYIYAEPTTLTGSIGIFGMIPSVKKLREKVGIDIDGVQTNLHGLMETNMIYEGMSKEETQLMQRMIERGYDLFTRRCAEGRHISQDSIKAIAEGRVWLGRDALALGLVDELGGINDAVRKAAELAGLSEYRICQYPESRGFWDRLMDGSDDRSEEEKLLMRIREMVRAPRVLTLMPEIKIENR